MAEKKHSVLNTLTELVVFTGSLDECESMIKNDKSGFLVLALN